MNMITFGRLTASSLLLAGMTFGGVALAQSQPTPYRIFAITMAHAAQVKEAHGQIDDKAAQAAEELAISAAATEAGADAPLRADDKGYYFSFAQTTGYAHSRRNELMGDRSAADYKKLRCRLGVSVEPSGASSPSHSTWRVCPDAQGRYRVTL